MADTGERRACPRRRVQASVLCTAGEERGDGELVNISLSGALIEPAGIRPRLGAPVKLRFPTAAGGTAEVIGTVVRHTPAGFAVRFSATNPAVKSLVERGEIAP